LNVWHENPGFYVGEIEFRLPAKLVFLLKNFLKTIVDLKRFGVSEF
tara:strand:- start:1768 stop:1905 length:138 start_codon:yes stop_codon:yes gene_type:complete